MNLQARQETETIFDDGFWNRIDVVSNALDNFKARTYVSGKCLRFSK
jgi:ubiquitin-activating enzyme E1